VHRIALLEIVLRQTIFGSELGDKALAFGRSQPAGIISQSGTLVNFNNVLAIKDVNHPEINIKIQASNCKRLVSF
jgi:hypothetical protein